MEPRDAADAERGASGFSPVIIETPPRSSATLPPSNGSDLRVIEVELKGVRSVSARMRPRR